MSQRVSNGETSGRTQVEQTAALRFSTYATCLFHWKDTEFVISIGFNEPHDFSIRINV
jgi:hypothetical protein